MDMERVNGLVEQFAGQPGWAAVGVALVAVVVGLVFWKCSAGSRTPPVPPGSMGWPVLGETLDYLGAKRANITATFFTTRVAKYGEVFKTHLFLDPAVSVGGADGNKFLFANENKLVENRWPRAMIKLLGDETLINQVGEEHRKLRRIFTNFFSPEGIQKYVPRMDTITRDHIAKHWEGKDSILGVPTVREFTFSIAADIFMSLREDDPRFRPLSNVMEDVITGVLQVPINLPGTAYHRGWVGRGLMDVILDTLIADRRQELEQGKASPRKDLLALMLTTPNEDGIMLTEIQIKDNLNNMLFAGHETSSSTMAMVLKYLHLNPECLKKVIREQGEIAKEKGDGATLDWSDTRRMKYTWQVVQETLRLQPPVQSAFRTALKDFQYAGYTILKGWKVFWATDRSHYDPKYFPNPEKFDPTRFAGSGPPPFVWIPFGGGPHMCLGNEFARTLMMVFLHHIVTNFEWKMVDPQEPICVNPLPLFTKSLQLQIWKRDPASLL